MQDIPTHFGAILVPLSRTVAEFPTRNRAHLAVFVFLMTYLLRTLDRFTRLHDRWLAGTLPRPRPQPSGRPRAPRNPARPPVRHDPPFLPLPRARAWLPRVTDYRANLFRTQLEAFLARTDVIHFLHAAPQAGRLLRPLCRLLGATLPPRLRLPPRPPRPRRPRPPAAPPAAPAAPPRNGKYSDAQLRRYRPGAIPGTPRTTA